MSSPTKDLEKRLISKGIVIDSNPVFRWMAGNVSILEDAARNIKPVKPKKDARTGEESRKRIDGIVALIMALGGAASKLAEPDYNQYFKEGWSM